MGRVLLLATGSLALMSCTRVAPGSVGTTLLGKTHAEIVHCAGTLLEARQEHDVVILTYYKEASILEEDFPQAKSSLSKVRHGCPVRLGFKNIRWSVSSIKRSLNPFRT